MEAHTDESVTQWIAGLKRSEPDAQRSLFDRYHTRILALARSKLSSTALLGGDEEDVALSVFGDLFAGTPDEKFPALGDRKDLWSLLAKITFRKAVDLKKRQRRAKRGGGQVKAETDLGIGDAAEEALAHVPGREPPPDLALAVADEIQCRLRGLADDHFRLIVLLKLEGHTNEEIAAQLGCTRRTVIRRLNMIRAAWLLEAA
jgi:DNA-directed RNA polymerase specialized sigma24 family protein